MPNQTFHFSNEQILTDQYKQVAEHLLSMAKTEQIKQKMERYII